MPFIISAGTLITGFGIGFQSVSLNMAPQIQRLYQLGTTVPFDKNITNQKTLNISKYSGQGVSYDVSGSINCDEPEPITINIVASNCAGIGIDVTDDYFISSYSYSKDVQGWGIESYTLITRPEVIGGDGATAKMIRGTAEGQTSIDGGADTGIVFISGGTTVDGTNLEVSAGAPGIGRSSTVRFGEVQTIGAGTGKADGRTDNGNVNIPYAPIFIPI